MTITFYKHYIDKKGISRVEVIVEDHKKLIEWFSRNHHRRKEVLENFFSCLDQYKKE